MCPLLSVSLDCLFLIVPLVSSKVDLTPPLFIEVSVSIKEDELSCIHAGVMGTNLFSFCNFRLNCSRQCGILFSFYYNILHV
jgi:hypothetical protein